MTRREVFVTGASGFIGSNLVRRLINTGHRVTCLVRSITKGALLQDLGANLVEGSIADLVSLKQATASKDWVFHLAGAINHMTLPQFEEVNVRGFENLLSACVSHSIPPTVVYVSSLSAVGPSRRNQPHQESATLRPVSNYGESKKRAEQIARTYADRVPISIARPPIVVGADDPNSIQLFQLIDHWRLHFIAGYVPQQFSVIHVEDLVEALIAIANCGQRIMWNDPEKGVYFTAADEIVTFGELGSRIGRALGKNWILKVPAPRFNISLVGAFNSAVNRLLNKRLFLTYDKAREATAGCWTCSSKKLKRETGWKPGASLQVRLEQTAAEFKRQSLPLPRPAP